MNGEQLLLWRTYHRLTQQQLADMLGLHRITVTRWENGTRAIPSHLGLSLETIQRELPKGYRRSVRRANPKAPA